MENSGKNFAAQIPYQNEPNGTNLSRRGWDFLDLTPEKYDICIKNIVVNGTDTGKISQVLTRPFL
jgi:hypothetical protein